MKAKRTFFVEILVLGFLFNFTCCKKEPVSPNQNGNSQPCDSIIENDSIIGEDTSVGGFNEINASNALFSVNSLKQVRFSSGNLQYLPVTNTWRFAENQYDFLTTDYNNITGNEWIDVFVWASSGYLYFPSTPFLDNQWVWNSTSSFSHGHSLVGEYANEDWGIYNPIANGGNQAGLWRTLTKYEWDYILNIRHTSSINGIEDARYSKAAINEIEGLIIFPDTYAHPTNVPLPNAINNFSASYTDGYSISEWEQMENAGAIFLPATGDYSHTGHSPIVSGKYWSTTWSSNPYYLYYDASNVVIEEERLYTSRAHSVRLVMDN